MLGHHFENNEQMILKSIPLDLPTQTTSEKLTYRASYVACNSIYRRKHQFSYTFNCWRQQVSSSRHDVMAVNPEENSHPSQRYLARTLIIRANVNFHIKQ